MQFVSTPVVRYVHEGLQRHQAELPASMVHWACCDSSSLQKLCDARVRGTASVCNELAARVHSEEEEEEEEEEVAA